MRRTSPRQTAPSGRRRARARLVVALAALLFAVALPAQADPTTDDPVLSVVVEEGKPPVTIAWSRLAGQLDAEAGVAYDKGTRRTQRGIYLDSALALAGLPRQTYSDVTVDDPGGLMATTADLIRHAAILFRAEDGTLRLLLTSDATAVGDRWADAVDGTLALRLTRRAQLIASMPEVQSGGELSFYASIPPQLDPARVSYEWDFNDEREPRRTSEPSVTHRFQARGRQDTPYTVSVTLYVDGKRFDDMLPLFTRITAIIPEGDKYTGLGADAGNGKAHSSGRGRDGSRDDGARSSDEPPAAGGSGNGGGTGNGGGDAGGSFGGDTAVTPPPSTPQTPVVPPPSASPPPAPRRAPRAHRRAPTTPTAPAGETVDGYLLASAEVPLSSSGGAAEESRAVEARGLPQPHDDALRIPTAAWVAVGLLALVVLGWGLESRTPLPYFRP
jgi:hypothetical protein